MPASISKNTSEVGRPAGAQAIKRLLLGTDPIRRGLYIAGMTPAVWYFYLGLTDQLGADPQNTLERALGLWALRFLVVGLAITPLRPLLGSRLIRYRRTFGLLAFYNAALHVLVYLVLDQGFDARAIVADIIKRPYITFGMVAFIVLVPLAITSNNAMIKRLGGQAWNKLHRFVYVAAVASIVHFLMVVKTWNPEPVLYAALIAALLSYRLVKYFQKRAERRLRAAAG
jgi:methionine sulfoxide reductase heme-binding subunit